MLPLTRVEVKFEPRDLWVGVYWDHRIQGRLLRIYVCLVPCLPLVLTFGSHFRPCEVCGGQPMRAADACRYVDARMIPEGMPFAARAAILKHVACRTCRLAHGVDE